MIDLPKSLKVTRNKKRETELRAKIRTWLESDDRAPGIHVSDLLNPRRAYWDRKNPQPLSDRDVMVFAPGKWMHAGYLNILNDTSGQATDEGSRLNEDLNLWWSADHLDENEEVTEFKTSRSFYEPKDLDDLKSYLEQVLAYFACAGTRKGRVDVYYLNLKDSEGRTSPELRCFEVEIDESDVKTNYEHIEDTADVLRLALHENLPKALPLCRDWLCGPKMCRHWDTCQPEGRYPNVTKKSWKA